MKRTINLKVTNNQLEEICNNISKMNIDCTIESNVHSTKNEIINTLKIKLYGHDKAKIIEDYNNIMNMANRINKKYQKNRLGFYEYHLNDLKYPVNKELIIEVIDLLNVEYSYDNKSNILKCTLNLEELHKITKEVYELYKEVEYTNIGSKPVRNIITAICYVLDGDLNEIIEECIAHQYLREGEEENKIILNKDISLIKNHFIDK